MDERPSNPTGNESRCTHGIASRISDELFEWLDGPVRRIGAADAFVGYAPRLEEATLPNPQSIAEVMRGLLAY